MAIAASETELEVQMERRVAAFHGGPEAAIPAAEPETPEVKVSDSIGFYEIAAMVHGSKTEMIGQHELSEPDMPENER